MGITGRSLRPDDGAEGLLLVAVLQLDGIAGGRRPATLDLFGEDLRVGLTLTGEKTKRRV